MATNTQRALTTPAEFAATLHDGRLTYARGWARTPPAPLTPLPHARADTGRETACRQERPPRSPRALCRWSPARSRRLCAWGSACVAPAAPTGTRPLSCARLVAHFPRAARSGDSANNVGPEVACALLRMLYRCTGITTLLCGRVQPRQRPGGARRLTLAPPNAVWGRDPVGRLAGNDLGPEGAKLLVSALGDANKLTTLEYATVPVAQWLGRARVCPSALTAPAFPRAGGGGRWSPSLSNNGMDTAAIHALAATTLGLPRLKTLTCGCAGSGGAADACVLCAH